MAKKIHEQVIDYLTDVHSIEVQALAQMRKAPGIAGDDRLAAIFREHEKETEDHEQRVRERLEHLDAKPSHLKDMVGKLTGAGFVLVRQVAARYARKLVAHAYSYEHMEFAAYELLIRIGERAGDAPTVALARMIRSQEQRMSERLAASFDIAVEASLRDLEPDDLSEQLNKYLADAHALEEQAIALLSKAEEIGRDSQLQDVYRRPSGRVARAPAARRRAARSPGRPAGSVEGRRPATRRAELGRLLPGTTGHAGQAGGLRVRVRAPRDCELRAAEAGRRARRRQRDRRARRSHR